MKLYQILTEKQLAKFLKKNFSKDLNEMQTTELKGDLLFGDFIICDGYKFKKVYSNFQCLETPSEKHAIKKVPFSKNPNDSLKWK